MTVLCSEPDTNGRLVTDRNWHTDELHVAKLLAVKRPLVTGRIWPVADIRQPEKSLSPYRSFRFLNFQRCHWQQPTQTSKWDLFFETR